MQMLLFGKSSPFFPCHWWREASSRPLSDACPGRGWTLLHNSSFLGYCKVGSRSSKPENTHMQPGYHLWRNTAVPSQGCCWLCCELKQSTFLILDPCFSICKMRFTIWKKHLKILGWDSSATYKKITTIFLNYRLTNKLLFPVGTNRQHFAGVQNLGGKL